MTLFIVILIAAAFIWFMLFRTKKETQSLSVKPAETAVMTPPPPSPQPPPDQPLPPEAPTNPPAGGPQPPQTPTW